MSPDIPIVETERLILRDHRLADFDAYVAMWADPLVTRFIGGRPRSREESWIRFLRHAGMWRHVGFGFWAIEEKARRPLHRRGRLPRIEARPRAQHRRHARSRLGASSPTRTARAMPAKPSARSCAGATINHPGKPMTCIIDTDHPVSIRVAEKHGFRERVRTTYHGEPTIVFDRRP